MKSSLCGGDVTEIGVGIRIGSYRYRTVRSHCPPRAPKVTRELAALFGSATRGATLGVLANGERPLSGYRIAKLAGCQQTKVNAVLFALRDEKLVVSVPLGPNRRGWVLEDPDLRRFLRRKFRVSWSEDWLDHRTREASRDQEIRRRWAGQKPVELSNFNGFEPRKPEEFVRSPERDRVLRELGLAPSRRKRGKD